MVILRTLSDFHLIAKLFCKKSNFIFVLVEIYPYLCKT